VVSLRRHGATALFASSVVLLAAGVAAWFAHWRTAADALWAAATVVGLGYAIALVTGALRRRELSVDVIAVLALAGALAVGEPFAGAVIAVMLGTGQLLEARADSRARRDLSLLVPGQVLRKDYSHAGQEPTVRDIEGTVGALLIHTPASMAGTEIEATRVDTPPRHVAVIARHTGERVTHTAVFRALPEGRYQLHCKPDGPVRLSAIVIGGRITETRWPDAGVAKQRPK
jgi:hypothetical protein